MKTAKQIPMLAKPFPSGTSRNQARAFLAALSSLLDASYQPRVILDLSNSSLTNSAAIDLLLQCIEEIASRDGEILLVASSPQTRLVLELTRIDRVAQVFASVEEAKSGMRIARFDLIERIAGLPAETAESAARWVA